MHVVLSEVASIDISSNCDMEDSDFSDDMTTTFQTQTMRTNGILLIRLCEIMQHNFENNRELKAGRIMLE